jgi:hypothetical protein
MGSLGLLDVPSPGVYGKKLKDERPVPPFWLLIFGCRTSWPERKQYELWVCFRTYLLRQVNTSGNTATLRQMKTSA